jgi:hypothetical protein
MDRPESVDDVWPHEEMVLAITESGECFDRSIDQTISEIMDNSHLIGENRHKGSDLSAYSTCIDYGDIDNGLDLIQNSLLIVEHSILETGFKSYLDGTTLPRSTWVVIYVDCNDPIDRASEITQGAKRSIEVVTSRTELLAIGKSYFRTICPVCSGDPGKSYVLDWSKAVYQRVEN